MFFSDCARLGAGMALSVMGLALIGSAALGEPAVPKRNYRSEFDRSDAALNEGRGYSESRNKDGTLAWGESYLLMAYIDMYHATKDPDYLRRLIAHFDRILKNRDDALGLVDAYAGRSLAGWGSDTYSKGNWHVWLVHTGMITIGPAQFVRLVGRDKSLQKEFGAKAEEYRVKIEEGIRDVETYWCDGPGPDEGYYTDPSIGLIPLNQQNSMGIVLLEMWGATRNKAYKEKVERLAHFFKKRLREPKHDIFDWAYWPKEKEDGPGSEDISHASINIDFTARCAADRLVFTKADAARFARTWLQKVRRKDGTWADDVAGGGKGNQHIPGAASLWLGLCPYLSKNLRGEFYADIVRAFGEEKLRDPATALGISRLLRYAGP